MRVRGLLLVAAVMAGGLLVNCSDDSKPPVKNPDVALNREAGVGTEAGTSKEVGISKEVGTNTEAGSPDGAVPTVDCKGKADGFNCSPNGAKGFICLSEKCSASSCGDKFVDTNNDEECDDGNTDSADGCANCKFGCKGNPDCDDKNLCTGTETCDTTKHTCAAGTYADSTTKCTIQSANDGVCNGGACVSAGCGNGIVDGTEECDDKNTVNGDGCDSNCKFSCKADGDCDDKDACNGKETCDLTKHACKPGTAPVCDDSKACTTDSCNPATGCVNTPVDADKDGHAAAPCGDDCNDADPAIYTGAPECADGKDNDCDKLVDEAPLGSGKCWVDSDGDSYAPTGAAQISSCACPAGYTNRDPSVAGQADCASAIKDANPGQTAWFAKQYCTLWMKGLPPALPTCVKESYDYNCSGAAEQRYASLYTACKLFSLLGGKPFCLGSGWSGGVIAACGATAKYTSCALDSTGKVCLASEKLLPQECH